MSIQSGYLYFISDLFFQKVNDPYLKQDHVSSKRPHYFAYKDPISGLIWVVPCSTRCRKYEDIIAKRELQGRPTDAIKIVIIHGVRQALLFQDMFPIIEKYIQTPYVIAGQPVYIKNRKLVAMLEKNAKKVISLIHRGIRFTPTQPDILRIERMMLAEYQEGRRTIL